MNFTTILYLTSKELNRAPLDQLQRLLKDQSASGSNESEGSSSGKMHAKLFGDREDIAQLLNEERKFSTLDCDCILIKTSF